MIDFVVEPEAGSRFGIARIAQRQLAAADQNRNIGCGNCEMFENRLDRRIGLDIQVGVGMTVAGEELAQPQRVARMTGSDEHGIADGVGDQIHAAQNKCVQEDLAQGGVGLHHPAQIRPVDFEQRAGFRGPQADQTSAAREHVHFAGEFSAAKNANGRPVAAGNIPERRGCP